jgi:hypothetical protein
MQYEPKDILLTVRIGATEKRVVDELSEGHGSDGRVVRCALRCYGKKRGIDVPPCEESEA